MQRWTALQCPQYTRPENEFCPFSVGRRTVLAVTGRKLLYNSSIETSIRAVCSQAGRRQGLALCSILAACSSTHSAFYWQALQSERGSNDDFFSRSPPACQTTQVPLAVYALSGYKDQRFSLRSAANALSSSGPPRRLHQPQPQVFESAPVISQWWPGRGRFAIQAIGLVPLG
jgi:hypothetical protein